jgi:hypothetical protein
MCFVWISEQTATFGLCDINWPVCITGMKSVCCAVRTGSLTKTVHASFLKGKCVVSVYKTIRFFFPVRPKEMLKLCGGKVSVKVPKLL